MLTLTFFIGKVSSLLFKCARARACVRACLCVLAYARVFFLSVCSVFFFISCLCLGLQEIRAMVGCL